MAKIKKQSITITELLAINKTADCRKLLKEHGQPDAKNYEDLQSKLVELYKNADDKKSIELRIAQMHPHKEFILKYCTPIKNPDNIQVGPGTTVQAPDKGITKVTANEWAGDEGNRLHKDQTYLYACGCPVHSGFDGNAQSSSKNHQLTLVAIAGIVAVVALTLYYDNKTNKI